MKETEIFPRCLLLAVIFGLVFGEIKTSHADMTFRMSGGTLTITGDELANHVSLYSEVGAPAGEIEILISGVSNRVYSGVRNLKVDLKQGVDRLDIDFISVSGYVDVRMGGDLGDRSSLYKCNVGGNYTNRGSSDSHTFATINGNMTIEAGIPLDVDLTEGTISFTRTTVWRNLTIRGSNGSADDVRISLCDFDSNVNISLGSGDDMIVCAPVNIINRNLKIDGGQGVDTLFTSNLSVDGRTSLKNIESHFEPLEP